MRTSIISRSVVAVATLAIGSAAFAATPATAASASGVTRDQVVTAVNGVRAAQAAAEANESSPEYSFATARALRAIIVKGCGIDVDGGESYDENEIQLDVMAPGDDAVGLVVRTVVSGPFETQQPCIIAAVATADASFQLSGTVSLTLDRVTYSDSSTPPTITAVTPVKEALSGDAFVTTPFDPTTLPLNETTMYNNAVVAAVGNATKTTVTDTVVKVADKKTTAEKKKAKAKYTKSIKSAKKAYAKALDKAGKSKSKKAKAKKAYSAKRAAAQATYKKAVANFKLVKKSVSNTENRPFSIAARDQQPS